MVPPSKGCFYFDLDGRPVRVASIQLGITARGEAADALQCSEKRLQLGLRLSIDVLRDLDLRTTGLLLTPLAADDQLHGSAIEGYARTCEIKFRLLQRDRHAVPVQSCGCVLRAAGRRSL